MSTLLDRDLVDAPLRPIARPGLLRLTRIELRKMLDTRTAFWMITAIAVAMIAMLAITLFTGGKGTSTVELADALSAPAVFLLPILGILTLTGESRHRTALGTYTLVPARMRVLSAKILAALALATAALALEVVLALLAGPVAPATGRGPMAWSLPLGYLAQSLLVHLVFMMLGVGFGLLLGRTAPAIVVYFIAPQVFTGVTAFDALSRHAAWMDLMAALINVTDHLTLQHSAQLTTAALLWIVLPLALGAFSLQRQDIA